MPFLLPDQQCQSTEGNGLKISVHKNAKFQQSLYGIVEFNVPLDTKLVLVEFWICNTEQNGFKTTLAIYVSS